MLQAPAGHSGQLSPARSGHVLPSAQASPEPAAHNTLYSSNLWLLQQSPTVAADELAAGGGAGSGASPLRVPIKSLTEAAAEQQQASHQQEASHATGSAPSNETGPSVAHQRVPSFKELPAGWQLPQLNRYSSGGFPSDRSPRISAVRHAFAHHLGMEGDSPSALMHHHRYVEQVQQQGGVFMPEAGTAYSPGVAAAAGGLAEEPDWFELAVESSGSDLGLDTLYIGSRSQGPASALHIGGGGAAAAAVSLPGQIVPRQSPPSAPFFLWEADSPKACDPAADGGGHVSGSGGSSGRGVRNIWAALLADQQRLLADQHAQSPGAASGLTSPGSATYSPSPMPAASLPQSADWKQQREEGCVRRSRAHPIFDLQKEQSAQVEEAQLEPLAPPGQQQQHVVQGTAASGVGRHRRRSSALPIYLATEQQQSQSQPQGSAGSQMGAAAAADDTSCAAGPIPRRRAGGSSAASLSNSWSVDTFHIDLTFEEEPDCAASKPSAAAAAAVAAVKAVELAGTSRRQVMQQPAPTAAQLAAAAAVSAAGRPEEAVSASTSAAAWAEVRQRVVDHKVGSPVPGLYDSVYAQFTQLDLSRTKRSIQTSLRNQSAAAKPGGSLLERLVLGCCSAPHSSGRRELEQQRLHLLSLGCVPYCNDDRLHYGTWDAVCQGFTGMGVSTAVSLQVGGSLAPWRQLGFKSANPASELKSIGVLGLLHLLLLLDHAPQLAARLLAASQGRRWQAAAEPQQGGSSRIGSSSSSTTLYHMEREEQLPGFPLVEVTAQVTLWTWRLLHADMLARQAEMLNSTATAAGLFFLGAVDCFLGYWDQAVDLAIKEERQQQRWQDPRMLLLTVLHQAERRACSNVLPMVLRHLG